MRLALDATAMPRSRAGAGVYTYQLVRALAGALPAGDDLVIFDRWGAFADLAHRPRVRVERVRLPHRAQRLVWEQSLLPRELQCLNVQVFHSPHHSIPLLNPAHATVVTVHDVTFRLLPWRYTAARRLYMHAITTAGARLADAIIVPSRSVAEDFLRLYGGDPSRVTVIAEAPAASMRPVEDRRLLADARDRLGLPARFLLSVGTLEPGKNRGNLLRAFAELRRRRLPHALVVVGQRGWRDEGTAALAERLGVHAAVHFAGYVRDADLPLLYNLAEVLVFPSWREGFGLPPLEALACGTPVVSSDRPAMPEVLGDAALYAPPDAPALLADAVERVLTDGRLRDDVIARGLLRAAGFSWDRAAGETEAVYRAAVRRRPSRQSAAYRSG